MAHFAQIDEKNNVIQVIVVDNNAIDNLEFPESESLGVEFCQYLFGSETMWKQTSYNGNFRKNYAGIGHTYYENLDGFVPPKPFASWTLNEQTCLWEPPTPHPKDGNIYRWDEETTSWVVL